MLRFGAHKDKEYFGWVVRHWMTWQVLGMTWPTAFGFEVHCECTGCWQLKEKIWMLEEKLSSQTSKLKSEWGLTVQVWGNSRLFNHDRM